MDTEKEIIQKFLNEACDLMDFCIDRKYLDDEDLTDGQKSFEEAKQNLIKLLQNDVPDKECADFENLESDISDILYEGNGTSSGSTSITEYLFKNYNIFKSKLKK